jgi:hypothetical protein
MEQVGKKLAERLATETVDPVVLKDLDSELGALVKTKDSTYAPWFEKTLKVGSTPEAYRKLAPNTDEHVSTSGTLALLRGLGEALRVKIVTSDQMNGLTYALSIMSRFRLPTVFTGHDADQSRGQHPTRTDAGMHGDETGSKHTDFDRRRLARVVEIGETSTLSAIETIMDMTIEAFVFTTGYFVAPAMAANDNPLAPADAHGNRQAATSLDRQNQTRTRETLKRASNQISGAYSNLGSRHTNGTQPEDEVWKRQLPASGAPPSPLRV